jgi:hypothetical protein
VGSPNVGILHLPYVDTPSVGDLTIPLWGVLYKELVQNLNLYSLPISYANVYFFNISDSLKLECYNCTSISCGTSFAEPMHLGSNGYLFNKYGITSCYQYSIKCVPHIFVSSIACSVRWLNFCSSYVEVFSIFWQGVRNIVFLLFHLQHWILSLNILPVIDVSVRVRKLLLILKQNMMYKHDFAVWLLILIKCKYDSDYLSISCLFSTLACFVCVVFRQFGFLCLMVKSKLLSLVFLHPLKHQGGVFTSEGNQNVPYQLFKYVTPEAISKRMYLQHLHHLLEHLPKGAMLLVSSPTHN